MPRHVEKKEVYVTPRGRKESALGGEGLLDRVAEKKEKVTTLIFIAGGEEGGEEGLYLGKAP